MTSLLWITDTLLGEVSREARDSPRLRKNRNFHAMSDPVHRLLNAVEPGTYIRPHRHLDAAKAETALVVSGAVGVLVFDESGAILEKRRLTPRGSSVGVEMPAGVWHTFVALEPGSVFFETKAGPFVPLEPEEMAPWAPAEGTPGAAALERSWREVFSDQT
ncbi:MAG: WbuC family cupin fold metalloprotein [Acidobacteriota bacterium]|nr:WbuC family cupin fold metalloprotein [Acidobacteriota bacterium]